MTDRSTLDRLRDCRSLLLAMEAVGWLHMTGKAHPDFLREQAGQKTGYKYQDWHKHEAPQFPWDDLLAWVTTRFSAQFPLPSPLTEFITKHEQSDSGVLGLLQAAHGITSGIEKNLPRGTSHYLKQDATHMWGSSAFGYPQRNLLADPPVLLTSRGWKRLTEESQRILGELKRLGEAGAANVGAWWDWRHNTIGPASFLRNAFSSTLAETRLPNNDVTLWDQSYVTAALFKSALAGAILESDKFPWRCNQIKQNTRWRLLTVGIGADHYEARSVRMGDWLGAREAIDDFFQCVIRLVEVDVPLGSLLYRDSSTLVFSFPGERFDMQSHVSELDRNCWTAWLLSDIDKLAHSLKLETPPHIRISHSTRSLVPIVKETSKTRDILAVPVHRSWEIPQETGDNHVCPVCLVRQSVSRKNKQAPCATCADRRRNRLDAWLRSELGPDTIWLGEVADSTDRIAMLKLSVEIEHLIEGYQVDSLRTQSIAAWRASNPLLRKVANPIDPSAPFESLITYVKSTLTAFNRDDPVLASLQEGYTSEQNWITFFDKVVEDRSDSPTWGELNDEQRARWIVHQLFRKLPSPGRIYRFWRQAEEFFDELMRKFRGIAARSANRWRTRRLILSPPEAAADLLWKDRQVYDGRWGEGPISLLYLHEKRSFVTCCNLARLLPAGGSEKTLCNAELGVTAEEDGLEQKDLKVIGVSDDVGPLGTYHPVIPLEVNPARFRVLVPLEAASPCVDLAVEAWRREFARVCDRLPLRVGIVGFPQKVPFQSVIETARRIEDQFSESSDPESWRVVERNLRDGVLGIGFQRPDGGREMRMIPLRLPDGRKDVFYPYFAVEEGPVRFPNDFQHPDGRVYRHASDLRLGDGVRLGPARIAAVFLDSAAKRFDKIEARHLSEWRRVRETWRLLERVAPSASALREAWTILAERQTTWRNPAGDWIVGGKQAWIGLARAVFKDTLEISGAALDTLVEAAADGVFEQTLQWHLSVLKMGLREIGNER